MSPFFRFRQRVQFLFGALAMVMLLVGAAPTLAEDSFLPPEEAFILTVDQANGAGKLGLHWAIAPGYYLYRDRLEVRAAAGGSLGATVRPPGEAKADRNFGAVDVYHNSVRLQVDAARATAVDVTWQGCAEGGVCYPPRKQRVTLDRAPSEAGTTDVGAEVGSDSQPTSRNGSDSSITRMLGQRSLWWTLPLFFVLGIGLAFTPCVLPMVPIISGIVVGSHARPRRALALSMSFGLAMASVYALLGFAAALAGTGLQALLQNQWTILGFSGVFVVLALAMFGFFELQLPSFLRERLAGTGPTRGGSVPGAAGMGALSALLVGPCMTAPLAGTLLYIAQTGNTAQGTLLLLSLGLGMGVPLLVISTAGARYLPKPGPWMDRLKGAFGFLLLATAVWMAQRVIPEQAVLLLSGALMTGLALTLWHLAVAPGGPTVPAGPRLLVRCAAVLVGLWGGAMVLGAAAGATDPLRPLGAVVQARPGLREAAETTASFETIRDPKLLQASLDAARAAGQPALVDFSADWCTSCKTIEKEVFTDPQVRKALTGVVLLRADVTASDAAELELMRRFQVIGPPTVMLFDRQGRERRDARLVGEFSASDLLKRRPAGIDPI